RGSRTLGAVRNAQPARELDVGLHLLDQRRHARKALLASEPRQEVDPQRPAVKILIAIEQVGLHQHLAAAAERWPDTDADRRAGPVRPPRVGAVGWAGKRWVGGDVGSREAELAAALVAVDHLAAQLKRGAQQDGGTLDIALQHQPPDVA